MLPTSVSPAVAELRLVRRRGHAYAHQEIARRSHRTVYDLALRLYAALCGRVRDRSFDHRCAGTSSARTGFQFSAVHLYSAHRHDLAMFALMAFYIVHVFKN